tara:strand:- start:12410 stop:13021 length:612 start_codon:yes stop_codon:yes gene_type:complete
MKTHITIGFLLLSLNACASETQSNVLDAFEEVDATTIVDAPTADSTNLSAAEKATLRRGEYMVELLGCGSCHTNGALEGDPDQERMLAGSDIGIAYTSPLDNQHPGVVFAPNITPDVETGIGGWDVAQVVRAIRQGSGRHGDAASLVMPWPGYARLSDEDAMAIARYLKSIEPIRHKVPDKVAPGQKTNELFVYFGFYRSSLD